jgi:hypothetical protein
MVAYPGALGKPAVAPRPEIEPSPTCLSRLSARMRFLIERGSAGAGGPYPSCSEADFAVAAAMFAKATPPRRSPPSPPTPFGHLREGPRGGRQRGQLRGLHSPFGPSPLGFGVPGRQSVGRRLLSWSSNPAARQRNRPARPQGLAPKQTRGRKPGGRPGRTAAAFSDAPARRHPGTRRPNEGCSNEGCPRRTRVPNSYRTGRTGGKEGSTQLACPEEPHSGAMHEDSGTHVAPRAPTGRTSGLGSESGPRPKASWAHPMPTLGLPWACPGPALGLHR